jgi:5-methyltetrahydropteroyltriglutamate--homocysteine methyltransferase
VTTKTGRIESTEELSTRIEEASRFVPLERLALSPQCGFATSVGGNQITVEHERAKLRTIVETAAAVWGSDSSWNPMVEGWPPGDDSRKTEI